MPSKIIEWMQERKNRLLGNLWGPHTLGAEFAGLDDLSAEVLCKDLQRQGWINFIRIGNRRWMAARRVAGKPTEAYVAWCESELLRIVRALPGNTPGIRIWLRPIDYARPPVWNVENPPNMPKGGIVNLVGDALPPWEMYARASSGSIEPASYKAIQEKKQWNLLKPEPWSGLEALRQWWGSRTFLVVLALSIFIGLLWGWRLLDHLQQRIESGAASSPWVYFLDEIQDLGILLILLTAVVGAAGMLIVTAVLVMLIFPNSQRREMWKRGLGTWRGFEGRAETRIKYYIRIHSAFISLCFMPCLIVFTWMLVRATKMLAYELIENPFVAFFALGSIVTFSAIVWVLMRLATLVKQSVAKIFFGGGGIFLIFVVLTTGPGWVYQQGLSLPFHSGVVPPGAQLGHTAYIAAMLAFYGLALWVMARLTSQIGPMIPIVGAASIALFVLSVLVSYAIGLWQSGSEFIQSGDSEDRLSAIYPVSACLINAENNSDPSNDNLPVWVISKDGSDILYIPLAGGSSNNGQEVAINTASFDQITKFSNFPETLGECVP